MLRILDELLRVHWEAIRVSKACNYHFHFTVLTKKSSIEKKQVNFLIYHINISSLQLVFWEAYILGGPAAAKVQAVVE